MGLAHPCPPCPDAVFSAVYTPTQQQHSKAAINNATYMLNTKVDEILFDKDGVAKGIRVGKAAASCSFIIGAPSYFPKEKVRRTGQVVRSICILKHYIAGLDKLKAGQIIIPQRQAGRSHGTEARHVAVDHTNNNSHAPRCGVPQTFT